MVEDKLSGQKINHRVCVCVCVRVCIRIGIYVNFIHVQLEMPGYRLYLSLLWHGILSLLLSPPGELLMLSSARGDGTTPTMVHEEVTFLTQQEQHWRDDTTHMHIHTNMLKLACLHIDLCTPHHTERHRKDSLLKILVLVFSSWTF